MRLTTIFKFDLPFESWTSTIDTTSGQEVFTYVFAGDRLGTIVQGGGGLNLITAEALPLYSQVRDLRDSKGTPIFMASGQAYNMYAVSSDPQFDPWLRIIGWKHRLDRALPRNYVQEIADAVDA